MTEAVLSSSIRKVRRKLGMPNGVVAYCFRHAAISDWVSAGIPVASVARMCGTSMERINDNYYHLIEGSPLMLDIPDGQGLDDYLYQRSREGISTDSALRALPRLHKSDVPTGYTVDKNNPVGAARDFLSIHHQYHGKTTLRYHCKVWYEWQGRQAIENDNTIRTRLYDFAEGHTAPPDGNRRTTVLNDRLVSSLADALKAAANLERLPSGHGDPFCCANGMLDTNTKVLRPPTPEVFNLNWSCVEYDPDAECAQWEAFLEEVYADPNDAGKVDEEAIRLLQEYMGYSLTDDTRQQKMLMMIG